MQQLKNIFFDFDGVIIDSEPLHARAKQIVLKKYNISYPSSLFDDYKGIPDMVFFDYVAEKLDDHRHSSEFLQAEKKAALAKIFPELKMVEGFSGFLAKVKKNKIRTALVSSTSLYSLGLVDNLFHISEMFDLVITEIDTARHKPFPDPYLAALSKLPASTENTIVIEDSPNGIIAAKEAGCFVYALTSSFAGEILRNAGADEVVENYAELESKLKFL